MLRLSLCGLLSPSLPSSFARSPSLLGSLAQVNRIVTEEGAKALLKGIGPRTIIISPLFGIALMVKETLARWFP